MSYSCLPIWRNEPRIVVSATSMYSRDPFSLADHTAYNRLSDRDLRTLGAKTRSDKYTSSNDRGTQTCARVHHQIVCRSGRYLTRRQSRHTSTSQDRNYSSPCV